MPMTQRVALFSLAVGLIFGLLVMAVAAVAGRTHKGLFFLGGLAWGTLSAGLMLTDCLHGRTPGPVSDAAFPVYFAGLVAWPAIAVWRQPNWPLRWLGAQAILLVSAVPAFMVTIIAALCTLT